MYLSTALPYAALVAFAALGANLLGTGLLILINPRSRSVRWHAAFSFWIMAWLALQGWFALGMGADGLMRVYGWVVHLMPAFFVAATLVETFDVRDRTALVVVAFAAITADVLNPVVGGWGGMAWQAMMWGTGAALHFRDRTQHRPHGEPRRPGERALKLALLVIVPIAVVGVILLSGAFLLYVMPLLTIVIQFLIFIGVVHHRFYDIEVRAARSGELAAQAVEQQRLALLGEVSATLAHEIRNPLTGMRSLTQRLAAADVDDARRRRYATVILDEIGRLERIVDNLLAVGRRTVVRGGGAATTPLEPLFDDLMLLVDGRARRVGVVVERDPTTAGAAVPRDALAQALLNLLINAVAHTPPGGRVRLAARMDGPERIAIRVSDTGPGVPLAVREQIFEPFHTRGIGAGLGLAVVRRLAHELDWHIAVSDADGGGACFQITVPAAGAAAGTTATATAGTAAATTAGTAAAGTAAGAASDEVAAAARSAAARAETGEGTDADVVRT
jgi:signal transduction histidine kinase